jgi:hypothetical protein
MDCEFCDVHKLISKDHLGREAESKNRRELEHGRENIKTSTSLAKSSEALIDFAFVCCDFAVLLRP